MIEKIKTITYEVRSHGQKTVLKNDGMMIESSWDDVFEQEFWDKSHIKRMIWHLEDVLKCIQKIEKKRKSKSPPY